MVPVAGEQAVLHRPPVQREAEMRAPIVEGVGPALVPEHAHRLGPGLGRQAALGPQLLDGADAHPHAGQPRTNRWLTCAVRGGQPSFVTRAQMASFLARMLDDVDPALLVASQEWCKRCTRLSLAADDELSSW